MVMELRKRKVSAPLPPRKVSAKKPRTKKSSKDAETVQEETSKFEDVSTTPKDTDNTGVDDAAPVKTDEDAAAPEVKNAEGDVKAADEDGAAPPASEAAAADATAGTGAEEPETTPAPKEEADATVGDATNEKITLDGFGGTIKTHEGADVTLKSLVDESTSGVIIFTYPKASTPGCTTQACLFRDAYESLTKETGFAVYGLSTDSPKANTTFKAKQNLPYPLLCDASAELTGALGLRQPSGKGTIRGVFVVDKEGKVLLSKAGKPVETLEEAAKVMSKKDSAA